jgi:hypothetical protein
MADEERRYTISELVRIAEDQTINAKRAEEAGQLEGGERFEEWCMTLDALRVLNDRIRLLEEAKDLQFKERRS